MSNNNDNGVFWALVFGAVTGAAVTMLTTPKNGKEMREELKNKTDELPDEFKDVLGETKELYSKMKQFLVSLADEQSDKAGDVWEEKASKAKKLISEQKGKIEDALNCAKEKIQEELKSNDK